MVPPAERMSVNVRRGNLKLAIVSRSTASWSAFDVVLCLFFRDAARALDARRAVVDVDADDPDAPGVRAR